MPKVSVVIPTYNSAAYVAEAIDSVLAQTFQDFEILVMDDGSTDNTAEVMKKYEGRVRYIPQRNGGVAVARNNGIAESKGDYIAFLDADDTWFPNKLALQMTAIAERADSRLCYSAFLSVTADLKPIGIRRSQRRGTALEDLLLHGNIVGSICTVLVEASLVKSSGGFDRTLSQCADWDLWVRLAAKSEFAYIDEPLVTYRQHSSNMSRNARLLETDSLRVLEKGFSMESVPSHIQKRRRAAFARNYMVLAGTYYRAGQHRDFVRCASRALTLDLRQARSLLGFPARVMTRSRNAKSSAAET